MEENEKKNPRALYLTLAIALAIISVVIIAATVAKRNADTPPINNGGDINAGANSDTLPDFSMPISGNLAIDYSDSVPVFSQTMNDYRTHLGIDISSELGTPVACVADGVVTNVWNDPFMGTSISVEHNGGAISIYKNLDEEIADGIVIGASVKKGDILGAVGDTAMNELAEEPHLHYEMKINGKHVDPKEHLPIPKPNPDGQGQGNANNGSSDGTNGNSGAQSGGNSSNQSQSESK